MKGIESIRLDMMDVDERYQRVPEEKNIQKIASEWDDMRANLIHVSKRTDGKYYVMDGNHTRLAYERVGGVELPCRVYIGLTVEQEADIFNKLNTERKNPKFGEILKARVAAGYEFENSYIRAFNEANVPYSYLSGADTKVRCHSSLLRVFKRTTYTLFVRALKTSYEAAAGRTDLLRVGFFTGMCSLVVTYPQIDDLKFIKKVQKVTYSQINDTAHSYKSSVMMGSGNATGAFRKTYADIYNKGLKSNLIPEGNQYAKKHAN